MTDLRITSSDLLKGLNQQQERNGGERNGSVHDSSSLAVNCWEWMGEHKAAIGTTVGVVAISAGAVVAGRLISGKLAQMAEGTLARSWETFAGGTLTGVNAEVDLALARSRAQQIASALATRVEKPYAFPAALPARTLSENEKLDLLAKFASTRSGSASQAGGVSGFEQMLSDHLAAAGKVPPALQTAIEGAPVGGFARPTQLTPAETLMHATHDGGAHHAGAITDDLRRDLLGVDPRPGTRALVDETLLGMRRSEEDVASTFARQMPALRFEMPALSVRPKG